MRLIRTATKTHHTSIIKLIWLMKCLYWEPFETTRYCVWEKCTIL